MKIFTPLLMLVSMNVSAANFAPRCPEAIETKQTPTYLPKDWQFSIDPGRSRDGKLRGTMEGFAYNDPYARLVPDTSVRSRKNKDTYTFTWRFDKSEHNLIMCTYSQTRIILHQRLPKGLKQCILEKNIRTEEYRAWCK